jgi:hypothetical protein
MKTLFIFLLSLYSVRIRQKNANGLYYLACKLKNNVDSLMMERFSSLHSKDLYRFEELKTMILEDFEFDLIYYKFLAVAQNFQKLENTLITLVDSATVRTKLIESSEIIEKMRVIITQNFAQINALVN